MPFGKYKWQDISVVKRDSSYVKWLLSQKWFKVGYPMLYEALDDWSYHIPIEKWMEKLPTCAYVKRKERFKKEGLERQWTCCKDE